MHQVKHLNVREMSTAVDSAIYEVKTVITTVVGSYEMVFFDVRQDITWASLNVSQEVIVI